LRRTVVGSEDLNDPQTAVWGIPSILAQNRRG